jgi:hypothetical protein
MKKVVLGLLLTSACLCATEQYKVDRSETLTARQEHHMAWYTKDALRTQSPHIHLAKRRSDETVRKGDKIVKNKTTITAFIPYGK